MAKDKNNKKVAFYKQTRKHKPGMPDDEIRKLWLAKCDAEQAAAAKAKEEAENQAKEKKEQAEKAELAKLAKLEAEAAPATQPQS